MISAETDVDRFEIDEELLEIFSAEADDLFNKIYSSLALVISGHPPDEPLWEIRRNAHTLKGAAGAVGLDAVAELAHRFEDAVDEYRNSVTGDLSLLTEIAAALPLSIHQSHDEVRSTIQSFKFTDNFRPENNKPNTAPKKVCRAELLSTNPASVARISLLKVEKCAELSMQLLSPESSSLSSYFTAQSSDVKNALAKLGEILREKEHDAELHKTLRELSVIESSLSRLASDFKSRIQDDQKILAELSSLLGGMRLICFGTIEPRLKGAIRAAANEAGTSVELYIENGDVEIDTLLLTELAEPILHILRNASIHGIEPPEDRIAAGKPASGSILIRLCRTDGEYEIRISDDGRGIDVQKLKRRAFEQGHVSADQELSDAELLELIFLDGLSTAQTVGMTAGRGVGMRIVRESVESRGGSMSIENSPGRGTTMVLNLPIEKKPAQKPALDHSGTKCALVVDDSASVRFTACSILKNHGFEVLTCVNGRDAWTMLEKLHELPSIIISDVEMPEMDGLELLKSLKADDRFSAIPVIICSSRNDERCINEARSFSAASYLTKPFSDHEFILAVEAAAT